MARFHVAFYVLLEFDSESSGKAEAKVAGIMPTIEELQENIGKVRSTQWTVTELTEEDAKTFSRPAEQSISE